MTTRMTPTEELLLEQAEALRGVAEARQGLATVLITLQDSGLTTVAFAHPMVERAMYRVRDTAAKLERVAAKIRRVGS